MQLPNNDLDPVTPSTSEDEEVSSEVVPCWRCQIMKSSCDGGHDQPCNECRRLAGQGDWNLVGCKRVELRDKLQDVFPRFPGLGSNDWLLPTKNGLALEIREIYQNPVLEIQDMKINEVLGAKDSRKYDAALAFVRQFHDINTRWDNWYEPMTTEIINQGIKIQENIIRKLRPSQYTRNPEPLNEENLLIASAFRVMALAHRIMDVSGYLFNCSLKTFEDTMFFDEETVPEGYAEPSYKISIYETFAADPGGVDFSCMLQDIVETTQRMMLRQEPENWPVLFHVLCILKLTRWELNININYICGFRGVNDLDETWDSLCSLYLASTRGCDPLVNNWDSENYESLVGKGTDCVGWFESLSKLWLEGEFELESGHKDFTEKIDQFVAGSPD